MRIENHTNFDDGCTCLACSEIREEMLELLDSEEWNGEIEFVPDEFFGLEETPSINQETNIANYDPPW
jgi:hypothetical protein